MCVSDYKEKKILVLVPEVKTGFGFHQGRPVLHQLRLQLLEEKT